MTTDWRREDVRAANIARDAAGLPSDVLLKRGGFECLRCGHKWVARSDFWTPARCPKCGSPYWDRPRKEPKAKDST